MDLRIWIYDHKMKTRDVSAFIFQLFRVKPTSLQHVKIMQTKKTEQLSKIKHLKCLVRKVVEKAQEMCWRNDI